MYRRTKICRTIRNKIWSKICVGRYSIDLLYKYNNEIIPPGTPYAIFQSQSDNGEQYLISMGPTALLFEKQIKMNNAWFFVEPTSNRIIEPVNTMVCLPFEFQLTMDLIKECTGQPGFPSMFTVLNYPLYDEMKSVAIQSLVGGGKLSKNTAISYTWSHWPLILIVFCLIFVLSRFSSRNA